VQWSPSFECHVRPDGERVFRIGHQLVDEFLEFVVGRARPNTVRAYAHDLSVFFTVVGKDPLEIRPKDVMAFVTAQRRPKPGAENVVRIADGSAGLSAATIKRRLAAVTPLAEVVKKLVSKVVEYLSKHGFDPHRSMGF
jgi:integrase/recombinase XerD